MFKLYKECRLSENESFGDFCYRAGPTNLKMHVDALEAEDEARIKETMEVIKEIPMPESKWAKDFIGGVPDIKYEFA